jgi:hypothetical protein
MAWRIEDNVIRGEIDNRMNGVVRGKLWLKGIAKPVKLDLAGNACPDLAGCLLKFENPGKTHTMRRKPGFGPIQRGKIGALSASRKVRVFTIPHNEAFAMIDRGEKPPERMANCLYLEWFSESNGRVVIETTEYKLTISVPEWRLTPAEEKMRQADEEAGWEMFNEQLDKAVEKHNRDQKDPEENWNEHDYEKFLKECDARTDKYGELLDKYGQSDEAHAKIEKEMGWARELTEEEAEEERKRVCEESPNEPHPEPDPAREDIDWIRDKHGDIHHPHQYRCSQSAMKFWKKADKLGLKKSEDEDMGDFIGEWLTTGAKLAGALNGIAQERTIPDAAFTVAYLKRALDHLHQSQTALEKVAKKKLMPEKMAKEARKELFCIREGILKLMDEFRGRK